MSRGCVLGTLTLALAACAATTARAQTVAGQRARVQTLTARLGRIEARIDSLARLQDTIEVDGVRFVVPPTHRSLAEEAARRGLDELASSLGAADRQLFDGRVFHIRAGWSGPERQRRAVNAIVAEAGNVHLHELGGADLRQWGAWWSPRDHDLQGAYFDLVTSPAVAATKCFEGDLSRCAQILRLAPAADPWTELFDAGGRRIWVERRLQWLRWTTRSALAARADQFRQCVDGRTDAACVDLLRGEELSFPVLVSSNAMRSVMLVVRELGGEGTFSRLVADTTAALADRLEAAAGVSLDSLLATWRRRVTAAEPASTRVGPVAGWLSLVVVVLAGTLALRSTRWRLA